MLPQSDIFSQRDRLLIPSLNVSCTILTLQVVTDLAVSIYACLVGALLFIVLHVCFFVSEDARRYRQANSGELAVLNLYFVSVIIALLICAM